MSNPRCKLLLEAAALTLFAVGFTGGCDSSVPSGSSIKIDTLAGGTIAVHNTGLGVWGDQPWTLELVARVGAVDGPEEYVLGRVMDVVLGPDSLVYVLDRQAVAVRVFDLEGRYVHSIGRSGRGPGEFAGPYALAFDPSGLLWVADEPAVRYTVFRTDGEVDRTLPRADRYFVTGGAMAFGDDGSLYESGFLRRGVWGAIRFVVDSIANPVDTIPFPPFEPALFSNPSSAEGGGVGIPFTPWRATAVGRNGEVWVGTGAEYRVVRIGEGGDTLVAVDRAVDPAPVTAFERQAVQPDLDRWREQGYEVDEALLPDQHPYFDRLAVADDGDLWVSRISADGVRVFDVFDPVGRFRGSLVAPFAPYPAPHITADYIVGVVQDSLDVQSVEVYRIVK